MVPVNCKNVDPKARKSVEIHQLKALELRLKFVMYLVRKNTTEHLVEVVDKLSTTTVVFFRSERILKCKHLYGA